MVAPAGGETGDELRRGLAQLGIPFRLVPDRTPTRRTVTTVDDHGEATCLIEPASITSWPEILTAVDRALADARALVVSGGLPSGVPPRGLRALVRAAKAHDVPVVVDFVVGKDAMVWPMVAAGTSNDDIKVARDTAPDFDYEMGEVTS